MPDATGRLRRLLTWARCPVSMVVERHNHAFSRWRKKWQTHNIAPSHILHVDVHHEDGPESVGSAVRTDSSASPVAMDRRTCPELLVRTADPTGLVGAIAETR